MNILVACEFSGIVRDAFINKGHNAISIDLIPSETLGPHIIDDVTKYLDQDWDMMIAFPPCTYLANSGVRWLYGGKGTQIDLYRWDLMEGAASFFRDLLNAPIERIAIENPIPHRHANLPKYTQKIQPWQFGEGETKGTCLWLKNLPPLVPTDIVDGRKPRVHFASPSPDRWKERSRTYKGIAEAMAEQWS